MGNILDRILATKRAEVERAESVHSYGDLLGIANQGGEIRDFVGAMRAKISHGLPAVIAEIKRASPSAGQFRSEQDPAFDPAKFAKAYEQNGAACLSVLTDKEYFQGSMDDLRSARAACALPVLRKDFIVDKYQIVEARAAGADAVLFIMGTAPLQQFREWERLVRDLGMAILAEAHNEAELQDALALETPLVGINNRDLTRFVTDVETTLRLKDRIPNDRILVTESGIDTPVIAARMRAQGVKAFLVGGAFMAQAEPGAALKSHFAW